MSTPRFRFRRAAFFAFLAAVAATLGLGAFFRFSSEKSPTPVASANAATPPKTSRPQTPPVAVRTATATTGDVETFRRFRGFTNVDALKIVPRVRGRIESIDFTPGAIVEKGDVLFRIESFDYRNAVAAARANLDAAVAREARAQATHRRNLRLQQDQTVRGIVADETVETSAASLQEASAAVAKARTELEFAQKQLERTIVRSPIRGKISRSLLPLGTLVDGSSGDPPALANVVGMDPMRVYFYATDREFFEFQNKKRAEIKAFLGDRYDAENYDEQTLEEIVKKEHLQDLIQFELSVPGLDPPGVYSRRGVVNYVDVRFDRSTGVVALRGDVANPDYSIYPGVVCELRVRDDEIKDATLIDKKAVCVDLNSQYVWLVGDDGRPRRQAVELGRETPDGTQVVVLSGVKPGDRYVVDGVLKIRPGSEIVEAPPETPETSPNETPETLEPSPNDETNAASALAPA